MMRFFSIIIHFIPSFILSTFKCTQYNVSTQSTGHLWCMYVWIKNVKPSTIFYAHVYKLLCCGCNIFLVKRLVNFAKVAIYLIGDCYMINLIYSVNQFKFDMVGMIWITNPCYVVKWKMSCPDSTTWQWLINISFRVWSSSSHYRLWWIFLYIDAFVFWNLILYDFRITIYYKSSWPHS